MANQGRRTPPGTRYEIDSRTFANLREWVDGAEGRKAMALAYKQKGPCATNDALRYAQMLPKFKEKGENKGEGTLKRCDRELKDRKVVVSYERSDRAQFGAHSQAIAKVLLGRAQVLLGLPVFGQGAPSSSDRDADDFAAGHLSAYPELDGLRHSYEREHAALVELEGEDDHILSALSSGPEFPREKVGRALRQKVLEITEALYPGIPEWPEKYPAGGWPRHYVDLEELCRFVWRAVEEQDRAGKTELFREMHAAPIDGGKRWKVIPYEGDGGPAFVVMGDQESCKSDRFKEQVLHVINDPTLRKLCRELHVRRERVEVARQKFDDAARMLGHRLEDREEPLRGVCKLGY